MNVQNVGASSTSKEKSTEQHFLVESQKNKTKMKNYCIWISKLADKETTRCPQAFMFRCYQLRSSVCKILLIKGLCSVCGDAVVSLCKECPAMIEFEHILSECMVELASIYKSFFPYKAKQVIRKAMQGQ